MVKVFGKLLRKLSAGSKRGIGITEVLAAAAVLGILYVAVLNLLGSNHEALLRIRARDGAIDVAQQIMDSLSVVGVVNLSDDYLASCSKENLPEWTERHISEKKCLAQKQEAGPSIPAVMSYTRTWKGQPGIIDHTMKVNYEAVVFVSQDAEFTSGYSSLACEKNPDFCKGSAKHVFAKRIRIAVSWKHNGAPQSINVSGVIK